LVEAQAQPVIVGAGGPEVAAPEAIHLYTHVGQDRMEKVVSRL
jgi:hypothetical protein